MNFRFHHILLILIILLAVFFRFYKIAAVPPGLYPDEAINGNQAYEAWQNKSWKIFYPENNGREGLFINIQSLSLAVFGPEPWALRIVSAVLGSLTVLGVYFLTKELFVNQVISLASAFFLAVSFWHINFSRVGFRAITVPFLTAWLFYFLFKIIDKKKDRENNLKDSGSIKSSKNGLPQWPFYALYSILAGLFFGLGFHTYIAFRVVPGLVGLIFLYDLIKWKHAQSEPSREGSTLGRSPNIIGRDEKGSSLAGESWAYFRLKLIKWLIFFLTAFIIVLPIGFYFFNHPQDFLGRTGQVSIFADPSPIKALLKNIGKTLAMFNFVGDWNWRHNFSGQPQLYWPAGILFLIGLIYSIKKTIKKEVQNSDSRFVNFFLLSWFFIMLLPTILSNEGLPHALRSIGAIPPVFIFAGLGFSLVYQQFQTAAEKISLKPKIIAVLWLIFFSSLAYQTFDKYFIQWANNLNTKGAFAQNYVQQAKYLNSLPINFKKYVIVEASGVLVDRIPMPAQTIMFITKQKPGQNITYLLPENRDKIIRDEKTIIMNIK
ncbi:MAG: glycosyltransferase family 39 protein [Parcubacteria group bacterium]|nr:glycosyltransferase family 39 protein [Parcubacteria group bacterium]